MRLTAGSKTTQQFLLHASDHVSWICTEDYGYTIDFCVKIWSRHFDTCGVGNGMKDVGKALISPSLFFTNWQDQMLSVSHHFQHLAQAKAQQGEM